MLSLKLTDLRNKPADFSAQPDAGAVQRFWSVAAAVESGANSLVRDVGEAQERLEQTLSEAVRLRMISDVPLGAFLSGGIDSSMVVALMQRQATGKVKTFSIGFHEAQYNEATHAKLVAEHLGTDHTELYVTPAEAREVIPQLGSMYCEPFADSSQIPTYLLSRMTRQRVTVSLSGDGGDELFGGYSRYAAAKRVWEVVGWMPAGLRAIVAQMIRVLSPAQWDRVLSVLGPVVPEYFALREAGGKAHKLAAALEAATPERLYKQLVSHWGVLGEAVTDAEELTSVLDQVERWPGITSYLQHMCAMDMVSYLPDDILTKVDRASMAVALEARVPLLDHRVVELAWRIPDSMKLKDGKGKAILRDLLYRYVPQELVDRPKMGFGVPVGQWLRHELRDWAEDLLDSTALKNEGFLESSVIQDKWREHLSGRVNWQYYLWDVLMFQSWLREWRSNAVLDRKICNG